jgi:predicted transposase YdaD
VAQSSPHNALFKEIFSNPEHARVELLAILPPELTKLIDWKTLRVEPSSFVEIGDTDRFADILYRVELAGQLALLHVILEHQSSVERFMPLRTLGYSVRKWERCLAEDPRLEFLPPIIPIVLHHSETGWTAATSFHELFDWSALPVELKSFLPGFRFLLDDLSHRTDAELLVRATREAERVVPLVLWALRDARNSERLAASLTAWVGAMARVLQAPSGPAALRAVLGYLAIVADALSPRAILAAVEAEAPEAKEIVMTLAEQWKQEGLLTGLERGRQEGLKQGIDKGRQEGLRALVAKQLALKFGPLSPQVESRVADAAPARLEQWAEKLLTATSLEEALGGS